MDKSKERCDKLLIELRRITRAIDLHSKYLMQKYGLTGPQILVLKVILQAQNSEFSGSQLAQAVSLSQATITSILVRLVEKDYVTRKKSTTDKRKTYLSVTAKANAVFEQNPTLLQESFIAQFEALEDWE